MVNIIRVVVVIIKTINTINLHQGFWALSRLYSQPYCQQIKGSCDLDLPRCVTKCLSLLVKIQT